MTYMIKLGDVVISLSEKIVYAKVENGVFVECNQKNASHLWDRVEDTAYTLEENITLDSTEEPIPEDYQPYKFVYAGGVFTYNSEWVEPEPPLEEQVKNLSLALAEQIILNNELTTKLAEQSMAIEAILTEIIPSLLQGE